MKKKSRYKRDLKKHSLSHEQIITLEKLASLEFSNISEMFRWDILRKSFKILTGEDVGIIDTIEKDKSTACDIGLNAVHFKADNRE